MTMACRVDRGDVFPVFSTIRIPWVLGSAAGEARMDADIPLGRLRFK